ncbi:MAG TPA: ATP-binding cassette domain-containing protein [Gammaproteobacteria bacterium]|nr:ATP-binding cassette domain-containing protein [Gammaproteobacteria bacterium]
MSDIIVVDKLKTYLGNAWVHKGVSFSVKKSEIAAIVGGSGAGKSVLLRELLSLIKPTSGYIELFGKPQSKMSDKDLFDFLRRIGVLYQGGALFSSLTVFENIAFPMRRFTDLSEKEIKSTVLKKLASVELKPDVSEKYPSELSGGMQKRVALARAIALDPELLFLDEPSSGLDPTNATLQDNLFWELRKSLGLTIVLVTHELSTLENIVDNIIFLGEGKVLASGTYEELSASKNTEIHSYFHPERVKRGEK